MTSKFFIVLLLVCVAVSAVAGRAADYDDEQPGAPYQAPSYEKPAQRAAPYQEYAGTYVERSYSSWGSELSNSFAGAVIGFFLFLGSFVLLFWNEGRALRQEVTLSEARKRVRPAPADRVDSSLNGQLVHVSGQVTTSARLQDAQFGLSGENAINAVKLVRSVTMLQWVEHSSTHEEKQLGGGKQRTTTYTYSKEWRSSVTNSNSFKNPPFPANPTRLPFDSTTQLAPNVQLGPYTLTRSQVERINALEPVNLSGKTGLLESLRRSHTGNVHLIGSNTLYFGVSPSEPRIGDVKVEISAALPCVCSILAEQRGDSFTEFKTSSGSVDLFSVGSLSADAMISNAASSATIVTWALRVLGYFLMWIGLSLIGGPLVSLADVIPILGDLVGFVVGSTTFLAAIPLTIATIGIAWLFYRPQIGAALLLGAVALWWVFSTGNASRSGKDPCGAYKLALDQCLEKVSGSLSACEVPLAKLRGCQGR